MKKPDKKNPSVLIIQSFDQLQALIDKPVSCQFRIDEQDVSLPLIRVSPGLAEACRKIKRAVQPPFKKDRNDYDPLDPKYLEARDLADAEERALVVYSCCPAIAAKKPSLQNPKEIHAFIQGEQGKGLLTENLLDLIKSVASAGGLDVSREVQKRADFSYTPASES